jgi:hypothetical protein
VNPAVLLPQQLQGHPDALELLVQLGQVRHDPFPPDGRSRKEPGLEHGVVQIRWQRPGQARAPGPDDVLRHRSQADATGDSDRPVAQAPFVLQS